MMIFEKTNSIYFIKVTRVILVAIAIFCIKLSNAQDVHLSQISMNPLGQNPAMAGAASSLESIINYRSQWKSVTVPYKTFGATVHGRFTKKKSQHNFFAAGINFINDEAGDGILKTTTVNLSLAYHVRLNKIHKIGLGFMSGFGQRRIDYTNFEWGSQYDNGQFNSGIAPGEDISNPTFSFADFASGIVWSFNNESGRVNVTGNNYLKGNFGFSVFHFNRPNYSFNNTGEKLWMKYVFHGNALISLASTNFAINPGYIINKQGPNTEILVGTSVRYDLSPESKYTGKLKGAGLFLGAYLRAGDAIVINSMIELANYAIGFSYDTNISTLRPVSSGRGGFEIAIRFKGDGSFFSKSVQMN
jgi:type IX secretion system PorP/SprF family membrane protein